MAILQKVGSGGMANSEDLSMHYDINPVISNYKAILLCDIQTICLIYIAKSLTSPLALA